MMKGNNFTFIYISFILPFISPIYKLVNSRLQSVFVGNVFNMTVHLCIISIYLLIKE